MLKVGITGGIGSGKSTVSQLFELLGVPVYNADESARRLMNKDDKIRYQLIELFGPEAYTAAGLNRRYISSKVFNDAGMLAKLNAIVHPAVIQNGIDWMDSRSEKLVMKEAAIFFESGSSAGLDYIIGVYAPVALRIQRTMHRDNIGKDEVLKRMSRQIDEDLKMKLCDFVLMNDEVHMLIPQVINLYNHLTSLSLPSA